jgi:hypothetical protein
MQEICQSGSEGGAKLSFVPTPILNVQVTRSYSWAALLSADEVGVKLRIILTTQSADAAKSVHAATTTRRRPRPSACKSTPSGCAT